ncbi:MAG: class E sortase [Actinobacteria bacterium]|nr:class E sortase [Actinomycetota bacterium]
MMLQQFIRGLGRVMVTVGAVVLLFVVYQLWGTGLREAQAQSDLTEAFSGALAAEGDEPEQVPAGDAPPETVPLAPPAGEAIAIIRIPKIGVEKAVVEGVAISDLRKGPGHYPDTPLPGQGGNSGIAGHRTTYGAPFFELDQLVAGDEILVRTLDDELRYVVDRTLVVRPDQVEVLDPTEESRLTLTTCHPRYSARERLIVSAVLVDDPVAPAEVEATPPAEVEASPPAEVEASPPAEATPQEALDGAGLEGDPAARVPALLWGALAALAWIATTQSARRWRRVPAYVLGLPVVLVVLFLCFEQVARLFPASI